METLEPTGSYLTPAFEHARVGDAMRPRVLTCDPQTNMVTVAQRMASERVLEQHTSDAIVVEPRTERPVGVLSTLDIAGILGWGRG
jgi:CBS domain-containing protein